MKITQKKKPLIKLFIAPVIALALVVASWATVQAAYPERPITIIVPWGAGGGTDAVGRIIASILEKDLGVPVNVVNRTGGSGVVGHSAIAPSPGRLKWPGTGRLRSINWVKRL